MSSASRRVSQQVDFYTASSRSEPTGRITDQMVRAEQQRMTPAYAKKVLIELGLITKSGKPTARFR